ncbi:related to MAK11 protein (maintenance of killer toxin-encoding satellite M1 dsRNA) [Cephalotrichum gorgonifer]|uniref:Related to MAK11 protein (Maintenance of killer toxin-encoding satellite M1 dsRNA) n=1 Tax=Cephalotrichum gorgonifer TaxID=2041049 RepID=A0AAE8MUX5_9PEZI|nr:related to MAK11 protein (maintenance of killer toxin-encoding satellite M1 dsRNA) [Cephalotrichum gorgonifer]
MAKRKRNDPTNGTSEAKPASTKKPRAESPSTTTSTATEVYDRKKPADAVADTETFTIQIVAGSYDRILHGITAVVGPETVSFADTFLFNAHISAIRALSLSPISPPIPGQGQKVFLVSGSTDEKINVYSLSAHPPGARDKEAQSDLLGLTPRPVLESKGNREVGALHHHEGGITSLTFPSRGKLLSAGEDSCIAVTRTRDWSLLSKIKAPVPAAVGRPSGDTAAYRGTPSGVNHFAVHDSLKTMISVSKGEKCMRLWNLVTGKKAGVLNFDRTLLRDVGEGKYSSGEGRKVAWGKSEGGGDEFAVAFDRDVAVFGEDAVARCRLMGDIKTKVHEISYVSAGADGKGPSLLAVSTDDGRVLFFSTRPEDLVQPKKAEGEKEDDDEDRLPSAKLVAAVGGREAGVTSRIKDFTIIRRTTGGEETLYVIGGSSDGNIRIWRVGKAELLEAARKGKGTKEVGRLLATYGTQNRITCVEAFEMIPRPEGVEESEDEGEDWEDEESDEDEDEED